MVKSLDKKTAEPPDHVGWRLWSGAELWLARFVAAMQAHGHAWFGRAQARILGAIERDGAPQAVVIERSGLTKQAVQQLVDDLEAAGILAREPDPQDARKRLIRYTPAGRAALDDADRIKISMERELARALGAARLARLRADLKGLADALAREE